MRGAAEKVVPAAIFAAVLLFFVAIVRLRSPSSAPTALTGAAVTLQSTQAVAQATSTEISQEAVDRWITSGFKASVAANQTWCEQVMLGKKGGPGQFGQDVFAFRNLYVDMAMRGEKGFYVEAGANHYHDYSSTYFYDKCLGWDGLCVEPQARYHDEIKAKRSCTLIPKCLAKTETTMWVGEGVMGASNADNSKGGSEVKCGPLDTMLKDVGRDHVDFFALDVEGAEMDVLNTLNWGKLSFGGVLIEDNKLYGRQVDYLMNMKGYQEYHQMAIDCLYTKRGSKLGRQEVWYPKKAWKMLEGICEMQGTCRHDCPK